MTYQQILSYMYEKLPMYQRIGSAAYKADLGNTHRLCQLLDHPENKFLSIHVAGTNGKGTTSNLIASVLQQAGYKTGLYTSPHYTDFRERIRINGQMIPENEVVRFIENWENQFEAIGLSFFEMTVGLAFDYFAREKVDYAVIEVGMGGRLDSTNVITPLVSVITNIGLDHTKFLGNTLEAIANEKAGIIKSGVPLVVGETQKETKSVFLQKAEENQSPITFADQQWKIEPIGQQKVNIFFREMPYLTHTDFPPAGSYQLRNLATVMESLRTLEMITGNTLSKETIASGIANLINNTGFKGRWQTIGISPLIICDSGHNEDGIREVIKNINNTPYQNLHMVFGMVNDKDTTAILKLLPRKARYYFTRPGIPRGLSPEILAANAMKAGLIGEIYPTVKEALDAAKSAAGKNDLIFVGGSTFVVAEVV
ncbi:MAG: bifunctional folylpolyglutamate synthase/dihydrofolate synthase [Sphingobacteriia bacterium]|nr:bifunctional folylpolyglutamate synthase/dihydrofolate synthase [Sphingobacteriia bacterium]